MILTLYDKDHNKIRPLYDIKDYHIDSVLSTGDKTLSFIIPGSQLRDISNESYVRDKDEFVIKSITPASEGWYQIQCNLNVEALESYIEKFETVEKTMKECLDYAFVGTGWRVGVCEITKRRTLRRTNTTPWQILQDARKTYRAEIAINSIDKVIDIYSHIGVDKGVYFAEQLNLKDLKKQSTSFNFYTQILPKGKDNLTIESVNGGKDTLSDFSYSTKVKTFLWIDQRYTVAKSLKEDAQYKLNEMSKPVIAYTVSVIDLAKMSDVYKDVLAFRLGDTVTLLHKSSNTCTKTRIVKTTVYPNEPNRNTCDVANSILTLEDIQQDLQDAADTVSNVTTNNGELDGSKVDSITTNQISDFSAKVGEITDLTAIKASITDLYATRATIQDLQAVNARIGTLEATSITTTIFNAELAKINQAIIGKADIIDLNAASGKINVLESQVSTITTLIGGSATVGDIHTLVLNAENTTIANALIKSAMIDSLTANKITAGVIDASSIHFKSKSGNMDIFDNTLLIKDATRSRVQIGKDAAGDYNIYVWDKTGKLMFDATGVTADGIQKPIIRNDMVSPNANIDGSKINITSLVTEINGSTTKINSSHVLYDGKSLDVAFNEMQTTVDGNNTTIGNLSTQLTVQQGKIATLITDTSQTKQDLTDTKGTVTTLQTNYSSLQQTVTGLSTTVGQHTSSITKVQNDFDNLQIGSRNLIKKSSFDTFDKTYWTATTGSTITTGITDPNGGKRALHLKVAQANSFILLNRSKQVFPSVGVYSLSIWLRGNKTGKVDVTLNSSAPHPTGKYITCNVTTTWQKFTLTCNVDNLSLLYDFVIGGYNSWVDLTLELDVAFPMLVLGNKPTDWSPAPEDTASDIKAVSDKQTSFQATLDGINGKVSSIESTTTAHTNSINGLTTTVNETKSAVANLKLDYDGFKVNVSNTYTSKTEFTVSDELNRALALMATGKLIYQDPTFMKGLNGIKPYNDTFTFPDPTLTTERVDKPIDCPTSSSKCIKITVGGPASPGLGGFVQVINPKPNAQFIVKYLIKLPLGYFLNSGITWGTGTKIDGQFLGSTEGTGNWKEYVCRFTFGSTHIPSSSGFVYIVGKETTPSEPLEWYLGAIYCYDVTDADDVYSKFDNYSTTSQMNSAITLKANEINLTVAQKVDKNTIISSINQTAEAVKISASKIVFEGLVTANQNFRILLDGSIVAKNATITGNINATTGVIAKWRIQDWGFVGANQECGLCSDPTFNEIAFWCGGRGVIGDSAVMIRRTGIINCLKLRVRDDIMSNDGKYFTYSYNVQSFGHNAGGSTGTYLSYQSGNAAFGIDSWRSDVRVKKNIAPTKVKALSIINAIQHASFDRTDVVSHIDCGYVAQQLELLDTRFITKVRQPDGSDICQINSTTVIPYITKAVQELSQDVVNCNLDHQRELQNLKNEYDSRLLIMENRIRRLESN